MRLLFKCAILFLHSQFCISSMLNMEILFVGLINLISKNYRNKVFVILEGTDEGCAATIKTLSNKYCLRSKKQVLDRDND